MRLRLISSRNCEKDSFLPSIPRDLLSHKKLTSKIWIHQRILPPRRSKTTMKLLPLTVLVLATSPVVLAGANPPSPPPPDVPDELDFVETSLDEPLRVFPADEVPEPKVRDGKGKGGKGKGGKGKGGDSESGGKGKDGSKSSNDTSGKGKGASKGKGGKGKGGKGKGSDDGSKGKGSSKGKGESKGKGSMDDKGGNLDTRGIVSDPDVPIAQVGGPPELGTLCTISVDGSSAQVVPPPATATETTTNFQIEFASDLSHAMFELDVWFGTSITQATLNCGQAGENGPIVIQVFGNDDVGVDTHGTLSFGILTNDEIPTTVACGDVVVNNIASLYEAILQRKIYLTIESSENGSQVRAQVMKGCSS